MTISWVDWIHPEKIAIERTTARIEAVCWDLITNSNPPVEV
jgi:hypothetical protein